MAIFDDTTRTQRRCLNRLEEMEFEFINHRERRELGSHMKANLLSEIATHSQEIGHES